MILKKIFPTVCVQVEIQLNQVHVFVEWNHINILKAVSAVINQMHGVFVVRQVLILRNVDIFVVQVSSQIMITVSAH